MDYVERVNHLPQSVVQELQAQMAAGLDNHFTAAALAVYRRGEPVFEGSWGWIDPEIRRFPATPDALFDLASVTKVFTVTAFLSLVSEGRVGLDDPLVSLIPEFGAGGPRPLDGGQDPFTKELLPALPEYSGKTADPSRITIRHLLTHTSGLAPWRAIYHETGPTPPPPDQGDPVERAERWQRGLNAIYGYPLVGFAGDTVRYSDLGLILLGEALARVHRGTVSEAIRTRVLVPLGLNTVVFNPLRGGIARTAIVPTEDDPDWRGRRCWGEVDDENTCGLGGVSGHAGLFATASDVVRFGQAWLSRDTRLGISPALLDAATREQAITAADRRGLGWALRHNAETANGEAPANVPFSQSAFGHFGFTGTSLWVDPQRDMVVAFLTNRVYVGRFKGDFEGFRYRFLSVLTTAFDK